MTNRYNIDDGNGNTIDDMNKNWKQEYEKEKKPIKRSECPYGGIDCAWCMEDCE